MLSHPCSLYALTTHKIRFQSKSTRTARTPQHTQNFPKFSLSPQNNNFSTILTPKSIVNRLNTEPCSLQNHITFPVLHLPILKLHPYALNIPISTPMSPEKWNWENAAAGALSGFTAVAILHPLDVVRTRFQVSDGRGGSYLPLYRNTAHAIYSIARTEGLRGLYAGFYPAVFGSTVSWGLYFFFYSRAKTRYIRGSDQQLSPGHHLAAAAEAGSLVCLLTNPIWLVKTRLQLQTPFNQNHPYVGFSDAVRTIFKEEGWRAFYKGIGSGLFLVSHAAIQFCAYEELRKIAVNIKGRRERTDAKNDDEILNSFDYATLGGASKVAAILLTYPSQVIRARIQQRPSSNGIPKYLDSWHAVSETARFEGVRGFYRGITSSLLKNIPSASITFVMYENFLKLFKVSQKTDSSRN